MALGQKCLLGKHEDLNSDLKHPQTKARHGHRGVLVTSMLGDDVETGKEWLRLTCQAA